MPFLSYIIAGQSETLEHHGINPKLYAEAYITYGMNSWADQGGSDMWVRDYISDYLDLYAVYHAPMLSRQSQLATPKNAWTSPGLYWDTWTGPKKSGWDASTGPKKRKWKGHQKFVKKSTSRKAKEARRP